VRWESGDHAFSGNDKSLGGHALHSISQYTARTSGSTTRLLAEVDVADSVGLAYKPRLVLEAILPGSCSAA
jgi:hypothetical protein